MTGTRSVGAGLALALIVTLVLAPARPVDAATTNFKGGSCGVTLTNPTVASSLTAIAFATTTAAGFDPNGQRVCSYTATRVGNDFAGGFSWGGKVGPRGSSNAVPQQMGLAPLGTRWWSEHFIVDDNGGTYCLRVYFGAGTGESKSCPAGSGYFPGPADVLAYHVWKEVALGAAHPHRVQHWAMQPFRTPQSHIRSVEVNVAGVSHVNLIVYRYRGSNTWETVAATRDTPVVVNGHTKHVFSPAIPVTIGERLFLQVQSTRGPFTVYLSNSDEEAAGGSYLWCGTGPADQCVHAAHDLNAMVYTWDRAQ